MGAEHTREGKWRRINGGLIPVGIIGAYFAAPSLRFCNPLLLLFGGLFLGFAANVGYDRLVGDEKTRFNSIQVWVFILLAAGFLGAACLEIYQREPRWDAKCAALQAEMLNGTAMGSPAPKKGQATASEAFQALGCRPQL
ncbi:hypothetical protein [Sphingomonas sp. BK481]|uniref:hypothetical protein n=1 Tax=Sphingomonas sp. BK481 TaxID=2586981 RepID=UPI001622F9B0|nr:hypothetical protein [Sphingomonas sp. BK481]MBB3588983.1 hypothetical protein [Sphingomonas sp. BK481]